MAGMEDWVREAIVEQLGEESSEGIRIIDGIRAAVEQFMLPPT